MERGDMKAPGRLYKHGEFVRNILFQGGLLGGHGGEIGPAYTRWRADARLRMSHAYLSLQDIIPKRCRKRACVQSPTA